jgi:hypothetical protein
LKVIIIIINTSRKDDDNDDDDDDDDDGSYLFFALVSSLKQQACETSNREQASNQINNKPQQQRSVIGRQIMLQTEAYNNYRTKKIFPSYTFASLRDYFKDRRKKNHWIDGDRQKSSCIYLNDFFSEGCSNSRREKKRDGINIKHHLSTKSTSES